MQSLEMASLIANILNNRKAEEIKVLKVEDLTVLTDYFVIATGTSSTQVRSLADEVEFQLGQRGIEPKGIEGYETRNWILLDYGSVIVHVFYPDTRDFYDIEHLWADGIELNMKDILVLEEEPGNNKPE